MELILAILFGIMGIGLGVGFSSAAVACFSWLLEFFIEKRLAG